MAMERRAERIREGIQSIHDDQLARPLEEHFSDCELYLANKRVTDQHRRRTMGFLRAAARECGWCRLADVQPMRLIAHLDGIRVTDKPPSPRAYNARLGAWRHFTRWAVKQQRLPNDPLTSLSMLSVTSDLRVRRRALDPDELRTLLDATRDGATRDGMSPEDRYALYLTALATGLRRNALESLTQRSFDFEADPPVVVVEAAYSKQRRRDVQPVTPDATAELQAWMRTKHPDTPLCLTFRETLRRCSGRTSRRRKSRTSMAPGGGSTSMRSAGSTSPSCPGPASTPEKPSSLLGTGPSS